MADQSDVEQALADLCGKAVYGTTSPPTAVPLCGLPVEVYRGWPGSVKLDKALSGPDFSAVVSIFTRNELERTTTRYPRRWEELAAAPATLTATAVGASVAFGGDCSRLPLNIAVATPAGVWTYACGMSDTPATVAAAFAGLIPGATASGPALTCPQAVNRATVGTAGLCVRKLRTQTKVFTVTVWAHSPATRDILAKVLDTALAVESRLVLSDGTRATVWYEWSRSDDGLQKAGCYRRDFAYRIEYSTTEAKMFTDVVAASANVEVV